MIRAWFFQRNAKEFGPFSANEMRLKAAEGEIRPTDLIRRDGMSQPVPARNVPSLFGRLRASNGTAEHGDKSDASL